MQRPIMWNRAGSSARPYGEESMALEFSICEVRWERYPRVSENAHARDRPKTCVARKIHAHSRLAEMQVVADHRWSAGPDCFRVVLARRFLSQNGRQTERDERQQQEHLRLGTHRHLGIPAHRSWLRVSISHSTVIGRLRHSSDASHSAARPILNGPRLPSTSRWKQRLRPT